MASPVRDAEVPAREVPHERLVDGQAHRLLELRDHEVVLPDLHLAAREGRQPELGGVRRVELPGEPHRGKGGAGCAPEGELELPRPPGQDVHVGVDGDRALGVYHVYEPGDALGVHGVLRAATGHGRHVLHPPVQFPQGVLLVGEEPVEVDDVLVVQPRSDGGGAGKEDVAVPAREGAHLHGVRHLSREVVGAREAVGEHPPAVPVEIGAVGLHDVRPVRRAAEPAEIVLQDAVRTAGNPFEVLRRDPPGTEAAAGGERGDELRAAALEPLQFLPEALHLGGPVADAGCGPLEGALHRSGPPLDGGVEREPDVLDVLEVHPSLEVFREPVVQEMPAAPAVIGAGPVDVLPVHHRPLREAPEGGCDEGRHRVVLLLRDGVLLRRVELPADGDGSVARQEYSFRDERHGDAFLQVDGLSFHVGRHSSAAFPAARLNPFQMFLMCFGRTR